LVSSWEKYAAAMIATYGKPNCIHVEVAWPALIPASRIAQKFNIPLLLTEHHSLWLPVRFSKEHRLKTYLLKKYGAQVSRISAVSEPLATAISRQLSQTIDITPNLVQEIYMSLPFKPQDPEAPVFLHVSNFAPVKQPSTILQAFVEAKKSGMKGRMLMAGEPGPLKSACQTFARQSIYKNDIDILDQMDASAMAQLIQRCDILVGFSLYETQGITLAEGFALGKQVIQSDLEVLHMYPDWFPLTRVRSSQELKEAMIHAAEKPHTAPKEDMRKVITNSFGTKAVADSFKQLYRL
jgi:glycosyltransferase involved in cell wall biosynthesis